MPFGDDRAMVTVDPGFRAENLLTLQVQVPRRLSAPAARNAFYDEKDPLKMSGTFKSYMAGLMRCLPEILPFFAPTVNSYKRINAPRTISGATWSPNSITWTGNNRTHMVRVPGPGP